MLKDSGTLTDIQPNHQESATKAAYWLMSLALVNSDRFSICLAGGSTPKLLYEILAQGEFYENMPWQKIHWFWGDERYVSSDDPMSNFAMVNKALLSKVPVPASNIHAIKTDLRDPDRAAIAYEAELKSFYGADDLDPKRPLFDVTLLGIGQDGHTASLFPGSAILNDRVAWVKAVIGVKPETRITLTCKALNSCVSAAFLVAGREKRDIVRQVLSESRDYPATRISPVGSLYWYLDEAAFPSS